MIFKVSNPKFFASGQGERGGVVTAIPPRGDGGVFRDFGGVTVLGVWVLLGSWGLGVTVLLGVPMTERGPHKILGVFKIKGKR